MTQVGQDTVDRLQAIVAGLRGNADEQRHAVTLLYRDFAGRIRQFMRHGPNAERAEELMQDVFVRVLRHLRDFVGDARQFPAWLWRIARNVRIDAARASRHDDWVDIDDEDVAHGIAQDPEDHPTAEPCSSAEGAALRDCVRRGYVAFRKKFPDRAQCLSWLASDRIDIAQIAAIIGRSEGATREYLSQCRKKLRPFLEPCRGFVQV